MSVFEIRGVIGAGDADNDLYTILRKKLFSMPAGAGKTEVAWPLFLPGSMSRRVLQMQNIAFGASAAFPLVAYGNDLNNGFAIN